MLEDDELKKEFEEFYSVTITCTPTIDEKFIAAVEDAIWPDQKELRKFTRTEFYKELINRKDND